MAEYLPCLRSALDILPSPIPERPGLLLRDPYRYATDLLLIPPDWVSVLACLDGKHTVVDAQVLLTRQNGGGIVRSDEVVSFVNLLQGKGFLETEEFHELAHRKHEEFRSSPVRVSAHSGSAYPAEPEALRKSLEEHVPSGSPASGGGSLLGLAAPHVSPEGGWRCYRAAYRTIGSDLAARTVVILGTSHYGSPERFGLSKKPFVTPLGRVEVDRESVDFLARRAPGAVIDEDYCHSVEHSIEFQLLFLQHRLHSPFRIVPILCGPFVKSLTAGGSPEANERVREFFDALGELAARRQSELFWILGVDLAHVGIRYGDGAPARAGWGRMAEVAERDRRRLERVCAADTSGLFELVSPGGDELRWCGYSPLYTFLAALGPVLAFRGNVIDYEQWNIDNESVVSFAAIEFHR